MGGKGRGVFRDFRLARVSGFDSRLELSRWLTDAVLQFQFRMNALAGNLPGVKKASW